MKEFFSYFSTSLEKKTNHQLQSKGDASDGQNWKNPAEMGHAGVSWRHL